MVGDSVVGMHQLNWVGETFKREYDGDMITVEAKGILPFSLTPEHPLLVISADNRPNRDSPNLQPEWKLAGDLKERHNRPSYSKGDYLLLPRVAGTSNIKEFPLEEGRFRPRPEAQDQEIPAQLGTAWLLGIYVAEGCGTAGVSTSASTPKRCASQRES